MGKVRTSYKHEFGKNRVTGLVDLEFDEQGISQETEHAEQLAKVSNSLSLVDEKTAEQLEQERVAAEKAENERKQAEQKAADEEAERQKVAIKQAEAERVAAEQSKNKKTTEDETNSTIAKTPSLEDKLKSMKLKEIKTLLADSGVDEAEYSHFKKLDQKPELIALTLAKLK